MFGLRVMVIISGTDLIGRHMKSIANTKKRQDDDQDIIVFKGLTIGEGL